MDEEFTNFLKLRGIQDELIEVLKYEKLDCGTLRSSSPEVLLPYIPKLGDRIAIIEYCKRKTSITNPRKQTLLQQIRKTMKKKNRHKHASSSSDEEPHCSETTMRISNNHRVLSDNDEEKNMDSKLNRQILVGWFCSEQGQRHVQIKCNNGGGTLKLSMSRTSKKEDILEEAKSYFFENGKSSKGLLVKFHFDLWDSMRKPIKNDITVDEMFHQCRQTRLRVYLVSTEIISPLMNTNREDISRNPQVKTACTTPPVEDASATPQEDASATPQGDTCRALQIEDPIPTETESIQTPELRRSMAVSDYFYFDEFDGIQSAPSTSISYEQIVQEVNQDEFSAGMLESTGRDISVQTLTVHRGHILEELIMAFQTHSVYMHNVLQVEIINTNGEVEAGFDTGGMLRDCLSEFWSSFYDRFTIGTDYKVPFLRHDMDWNKWTAVAKILYKGWKDEGYFPLKLCPTFIEYCLYGKTISDIEESFLNFLSLNERDTLIAAMKTFPDDEDDLLEIMQNLECKVKITPDNLKKTFLDIAHKEIIQKPMYVIDSWTCILNNLMPFTRLQNVYESHYPSAKNIIAALNVEENMDSESTKVYGYLKKYIRESNEERRSAFLRFSTGANMLTGKKIVVSFNDLKGAKKIPVAHTCGCTLEIPKTYENFPEFRTDFNNLFDANVWVFDIV